MHYFKRPLKWGFVIVHVFIIENGLITNFVVIAYYFSIFADVIFINLQLLFLMY